LLFVFFVSVGISREAAGEVAVAPAADVLQTYCLDCHTGAGAEARLDLEMLLSQPVEPRWQDWRRVARVLDSQEMPPEDAAQPDESERRELGRAIDESLEQLFLSAADDPGPSQLRRLTNAQYEYCIEDLTGVRFDLRDRLVPDSVGSSGFTNAATGQFMQADTLERYLEAAKQIAGHAVLGAGPLYFSEQAGATGMELASIKRIQEIYRTHGFRTGAGEGAEPYRTHLFAQAFEVAWRFRHRKALGFETKTLDRWAAESDLTPAFARHVWDTLNMPDPPYPLSELIDRWQAWPEPDAIGGDKDEAVGKLAGQLDQHMRSLQERLAGSASAEEEAALLTWNSIEIPDAKTFLVTARRRLLRKDDGNFTLDLNNADLFDKDGTVLLRISVESADQTEQVSSAVVIFENPEFKIRYNDRSDSAEVPLARVIKPESLRDLNPGSNPDGEAITSSDFVVGTGQTRTIAIELPEDSRSGQLTLHARLDQKLGRDRIVRVVIDDVTNSRVRSYSSLLRDQSSEAMSDWESGLETFAASLPQISHGEPAPSDRDPIPRPFDATYNTSERNYFHTAVKYYRDDDFLVRYLLTPDVARELQTAWTDLLTSFDFHDVNLRFVVSRYQLAEPDRPDQSALRVASLTPEWIESLPEEPRSFIAAYKAEYDAMHSARRSAQTRHLQDLIEFASRAWRQPLDAHQKQTLKAFYQTQRDEQGLDHEEAVRATIARILVSPEFLYLGEHVADGDGPARLSDFELAGRMAAVLWSSLPDASLLQAAESGALSKPDELKAQVLRMTASPKTRRFADEFFGQWLGFYQFDRFRGVDTNQFPEFDDDLKESLHDEAISFFEYLIRQDRPYHEILTADFAFLNPTIARHYGIEWDAGEGGGDQIRLVDDVTDHHRGGVLSLGALLTATSAPLRTSPVKRGDWILRRLLGTPVPPPPADAGSIAAEEVLGDGKTVRERLEAHRQSPECMSCHERIDPLGFALEHFDSLGRWRQTYSDDLAIDASGTLADGRVLDGLSDLKRYLADQDESVRRTLATNLVAYVTGRAESISDSMLIRRVADQLGETPQLSSALTLIMQSPQFQKTRGHDATLVTPHSPASHSPAPRSPALRSPEEATP